MTIRKLSGLLLIVVSLILIIHSILSLYLIQCLRSSVTIPSFFSQDMIEFFQLGTSLTQKITRLGIILIFPSLGIELIKNKKDSFLSLSLILKTLLILIIVSIIIYILFYPFFE